MGFRFRRSVRLIPGVRLNVSGSGVSTSIGGRGASVTVGRRGVRANVGLPGTGLSYSTRLDAPASGRAAARQTPVAGAGGTGVALLIVLLALGSCAVMLAGG